MPSIYAEASPHPATGIVLCGAPVSRRSIASTVTRGEGCPRSNPPISNTGVAGIGRHLLQERLQICNAQGGYYAYRRIATGRYRLVVNDDEPRGTLQCNLG